MAAGVFGWILVGAVSTAQAQGVVGGDGVYPATGPVPVTPLIVAQSPAVGLDLHTPLPR
jgi:hypothetical protein